jgi:hypothetical protein
MFERGIDPDVMDPTKIHSHSECPKQNSDWPAYEEVKDYVQQCHEKILEAFDQTKNSTDNKWTAKRKSSHNYNNISDPIFNNNASKNKTELNFLLCKIVRVYHLGMEHEMMHQETLLYMYQQLDSKYKHKPNWIPAPITGPSHVQNTQIHIPAGKVTLGANFDEIEWGWDNEFSKSQVSNVLNVSRTKIGAIFRRSAKPEAVSKDFSAIAFPRLISSYFLLQAFYCIWL